MRRLILILMLMLTAAALAEDKPEALFFFENVCGSCHPEEDFRAEFTELTGRDLSDYRYLYHNVSKPSGREALMQAAAERGIAESDLRMPLLIVDGQVYAGSTALRSALPRDFLQNESTDSLIYYIFAPGCRDCAKMDEALAALPARMEVLRGDYAFESDVIVQKVSAVDEPDAAAALFERFSVDEDDRFAPCLLFGGRTIRTAEDAARYLPGMIARGEAVGTPQLADG